MVVKTLLILKFAVIGNISNSFAIFVYNCTLFKLIFYKNY